MSMHEIRQREEVKQWALFLNSIPDKWKAVWERKHLPGTTLQKSYEDWETADNELQKKPIKEKAFKVFIEVIYALVPALGIAFTVPFDGYRGITEFVLLFVANHWLFTRLSKRLRDRHEELKTTMERGRRNLEDFKTALGYIFPIENLCIDPIHLSDDGVTELLIRQGAAVLEAQQEFKSLCLNLNMLDRVSIVQAAHNEGFAQARFKCMFDSVADLEIFDEKGITKKDVFDLAQKRIQKLRSSNWRS
ncbi:MAG: hypothetical protein JWO00_628 [Candidatus Parcubacteria bacterium]|nr:hypothetical protein [Candidatus Parcubacteria bacterium]